MVFRPEFVVDHRELAPEVAADLAILRSEVHRMVGFLKPSEQKIIQLRYGFPPYAFFNYTLEECSKILNVTRERVRSIEWMAIHRLSHPTRSSHLAAFVLGEKSKHRVGRGF